MPWAPGERKSFCPGTSCAGDGLAPGLGAAPPRGPVLGRLFSGSPGPRVPALKSGRQRGPRPAQRRALREGRAAEGGRGRGRVAGGAREGARWLGRGGGAGRGLRGGGAGRRGAGGARGRAAGQVGAGRLGAGGLQAPACLGGGSQVESDGGVCRGLLRWPLVNTGDS